MWKWMGRFSAAMWMWVGRAHFKDEPCLLQHCTLALPCLRMRMRKQSDSPRPYSVHTALAFQTMRLALPCFPLLPIHMRLADPT